MSPAIWLLVGIWAAMAEPTSAVAVGTGLNERVQSGRTAVAMVNGQAIHADEVERLVDAAIGQRPVEPGARQWLQAQALEQLIGQRLVEQFLARERLSPSEIEIRAALDQVKADAQTARLDFAALLAQRGTTEERLREQFRWELGWKKYLARAITDDSLRKHFEDYRREFDGSGPRVSQILLRTVEEAHALRERIVAGEMTFAEAARRHSTSPTADQGGDLGFIARHGSMSDEFSRAAFVLNPGEVSPPVTTQFGVHLIQVTEVRPGEKTWTDVREHLRLDLARRLFELIANQERPNATIRIEDQVPRFKVRTKEIELTTEPQTEDETENCRR